MHVWHRLNPQSRVEPVARLMAQVTRGVGARVLRGGVELSLIHI